MSAGAGAMVLEREPVGGVWGGRSPHRSINGLSEANSFFFSGSGREKKAGMRVAPRPFAACRLLASFLFVRAADAWARVCWLESWDVDVVIRVVTVCSLAGPMLLRVLTAVVKGDRHGVV